MSQASLARRAAKSKLLSLHDYPEFLGTGVVPFHDDGPTMAVAVYVSKSKSNLSPGLARAIPTQVGIMDRGNLVNVPTKIVDLGDIEVL